VLRAGKKPDQEARIVGAVIHQLSVFFIRFLTFFTASDFSSVLSNTFGTKLLLNFLQISSTIVAAKVSPDQL